MKAESLWFRPDFPAHLTSSDSESASIKYHTRIQSRNERRNLSAELHSNNMICNEPKTAIEEERTIPTSSLDRARCRDYISFVSLGFRLRNHSKCKSASSLSFSFLWWVVQRNKRMNCCGSNCGIENTAFELSYYTQQTKDKTTNIWVRPGWLCTHIQESWAIYHIYTFLYNEVFIPFQKILRVSLSVN
jgi:hypothetical protein